MIALHAGFSARLLLLWGEISSPEKRRGGKRNQHPFGVGAQSLLDVLKSLDLPVTKSDITAEIVWLPAAGNIPISSSPLIRENPETEPKALGQWEVAAISLVPAAAIELLAHCANQQLIQPATIAGSDLRYWATAMRFAAGLVARQQFLPDLVTEEDGSFHARWRAACLGRDDHRRDQLAAAMPSAARALTPEVVPYALLEGFLDTVVDELVRSSSERRRSPSRVLHEQWIAALHSEDDRVSGSDADLETLQLQVQEWRRPLFVFSHAPFRLCFRLEEPEPGETQSWQVRYLLQSRNDPSLLVPAAMAWNSNGGRSPVWKHPGFHPREFLLTSLGQAASISPRIEASLRAKTPTGYELDVEGAHEFLTEKAIVLEEAGFGVMLPAWWTRRGARSRLSVSAQVKTPFRSAGRLSLQTLLEFQWQISIGGEKLTLAELRALAKVKAPLVQFRGQWVQVSSSEIQAALDFWKKSGKQQMTAREVVHMALGATKPPIPFEFSGVSAEGWIGDLLQRLEGREPFEEIPPPEGLHATLRPYQVRGYSWLSFMGQWGFGTCLADDMGLGKTIQTLHLIQRNRKQAVTAPVLLALPYFGHPKLAKGSGAFHSRAFCAGAPWIGTRQGRLPSQRLPPNMPSWYPAMRCCIAISSI